MSGGIKLITATMEENVSKAGLKLPADSVREYLDKLGITEQDVADAVLWARSSPRLELQQVVNDIAAALVILGASGRAFKTFQPGAGPYGEPQLVRAIADFLNGLPAY